MRSAYTDMVMTSAWFTARARISCGTKFKVIRTRKFMYRRVARITPKLCIELQDTCSRESTFWMDNILVENSHIRQEQFMHRYRHMCIVSVVLMGQAMVHSSLERCRRTLSYCRNKSCCTQLLKD